MYLYVFICICTYLYLLISCICMILYVFLPSWYIVMHCTCIMRRFLVAKWSLYVMGLSLNNSFPFATIYFYPKEKVGVPPFESFWILLNPFESFWILLTHYNKASNPVHPMLKSGPWWSLSQNTLWGTHGNARVEPLRWTSSCLQVPSTLALSGSPRQVGQVAATIKGDSCDPWKTRWAMMPPPANHHFNAFLEVSQGFSRCMAITAWSSKHEGPSTQCACATTSTSTKQYFPRSSCSIYFHLNLTSCMTDHPPPWFIRSIGCCSPRWSSFWIEAWTKCSSTLAMLCDTSWGVRLCPSMSRASSNIWC